MSRRNSRKKLQDLVDSTSGTEKIWGSLSQLRSQEKFKTLVSCLQTLKKVQGLVEMSQAMEKKCKALLRHLQPQKKVWDHIEASLATEKNSKPY